ncbi:MAG: 4Fe-4S binding protein [Saprospiraceae bacterium]|nr:4Fe-4S binding protein [Saprospiraceae bacterium]
MKRGLKLPQRSFFLLATVIGVLWYGITYMSGQWFHSLHTLLIGALVVYLVYFRGEKTAAAPRSASPSAVAWLGIVTGTYLIGFYILLYWFPQYISPWIEMVDPVSRSISGNPASQWFLYGFLYTIIMLVMGVRMIAKYRHNRYQIIRTLSVVFFQTAFAFLLPEILARLNQPYYDFKNIWPLNYTFFFDWNLSTLMSSGGLGIFMLVWGIALVLIGVPVITYFYGKRWYCSWVCGCGGLAETLGDPYRQLSDKSLKAWKIERYTIHAVLVFAVVMTIGVLYTYFSGSSRLLFLDSNNLRTWYGFLIGSAFAGVVGTGFYPLMGNRMWCRFGCPLAAYLGLVQKFKSRFRITVNGGQCISCGNCSTYCEMGIDVRHYAQRGQDVVRSSCVGCGVCAAVCPRGVLRLENGSVDIDTRTEPLRTIHIRSDEVGIL